MNATKPFRPAIPPERDHSRIPIRVVSRHAIEELVASINRTAVHAE